MKKRDLVMYLLINVLLNISINFMIKFLTSRVISTNVNNMYFISLLGQIQILFWGCIAKLWISKNDFNINDSNLSNLNLILHIYFIFILVVFLNIIFDGIDKIYLSNIGLDNDIIPMNEHLSVLQLVIVILTIGIIPAICEEFFYRKVTFLFLRESKEYVILIISSIIFAISHDSSRSIFVSFVLGIFLMKVFLETNQIGYSIILHCLYNVLTLLIAEYRILPTNMETFLLRVETEGEALATGFFNISFGLGFLYIHTLLCLIFYDKIRAFKKID